MTHRDAAEITRAAIEPIDQRDSARPFILFLNYLDAHAPYRPPPFDELYSPGIEPMVKDELREFREALFRGTRTLPGKMRADYEALYDGGIAYIDSQLRVLNEYLRREGLCEDALIVVTADHGEAFGEHLTLKHGSRVYQEQVRVPLLSRIPARSIRWIRSLPAPPTLAN